MHALARPRRPVPLLLLATGMFVALGALSAAVLFAVDGLNDYTGSGNIFFDLGADRTDQALACVAQPDGQVVLAGRASDDDGEGSKIALARVRLDGTLDPGFGTGGKLAIDLTDFGYALGFAGARAVVVDGQGRLLVVGTAQLAGGGAVRTFVTRLLANGTIDPTFLYNGITGGWYFSTALTVVSTAALDLAGNLWILGPELADLTGGWKILRLDPNGAEFPPQTVPITSYDLSMPTALLFQPGNKPVIGGWGQENTPPYWASFMIHRLLAGYPSDPDPTFGFNNDGWVQLDYAQPAWLQSLALLPNLGLAVAGQTGPLAEEDIVVQRLTANGIADGSFQEYVAFDVGGLGGDGTMGQVRMVAQSDGKVLVAARVLTGDSGNLSDVGVARLLTDNQLDPSFGGSGTGKRVFGLASPPPGTGDDGVACLLLAGGKPVLGGWGEYIGLDTDFAVRRLTSALIFTDGFESGQTFFWSSGS
jgi:uncharacterized delta-60 repeat protein